MINGASPHFGNKIVNSQYGWSDLYLIEMRGKSGKVRSLDIGWLNVFFVFQNLYKTRVRILQK